MILIPLWIRRISIGGMSDYILRFLLRLALTTDIKALVVKAYIFRKEYTLAKLPDYVSV